MIIIESAGEILLLCLPIEIHKRSKELLINQASRLFIQGNSSAPYVDGVRLSSLSHLVLVLGVDGIALLF